MTAIRSYFHNIYEAIYTIFDGMSITFSYLFQKPITIEYPNRLKQSVQDMLPPNYRGFLQVNHSTCTTCEACAKACPIDCIVMDGVKTGDRKGKAPYYFFIDLSKCMFCGLCLPPCPTDPPSIYFTKEFEGSTVKQEGMVFSYVPKEVAKEYIMIAKELAKEKLKEKQAKAANGKADDKESEDGE